MTQTQVNQMSARDRRRLMKQIVRSFETVTVTGLYSSEADVNPKDIVLDDKDPSVLYIHTDICSG